MRVPRLCCRSSSSGDVWLVVAACALHHMPRTVPVEPMMRNHQYPEGGGGSGRSSLCTKFPGRLHSSPNTSLCGVNPVDVCTVVLYASIMNGRKSSQLSCSRNTNMANIASRVLLNRSTRPSFWFSPSPVTRKMCVPCHFQNLFPDPSEGTGEIRRWAAIYPLMRLPQSARSYQLADKPQCTW